MARVVAFTVGLRNSRRNFFLRAHFWLEVALATVAVVWWMLPDLRHLATCFLSTHFPGLHIGRAAGKHHSGASPSLQ